MSRNTLLTAFILLIAYPVLAIQDESGPAAVQRPKKIWRRP